MHLIKTETYKSRIKKKERKKKPCVETKGNWNNLLRIRRTIARIIEQQIFNKVNKIYSSTGLKFLREKNILIRLFVQLRTNKSFDYHNTISRKFSFFFRVVSTLIGRNLWVDRFDKRRPICIIVRENCDNNNYRLDIGYDNYGKMRKNQGIRN